MEAVLIDYLLAIRYNSMPESEILKMDLGTAIAACKSAGILTDRTVQLADLLRSYRNLIHPGRVIRLQEPVDEEGARVAHALVEMVVREISAKREERYGPTAEQIVMKIQRDPGVVGILNHLLKGMQVIEIERLLLRVVPAQYIGLSEEYEPPDVFASLKECFHLALLVAPDELKKKVAKRHIVLLKEENAETISTYEYAFFRATYLQYYDPDEAQLVKEHCLSVMERNLTYGFLQDVLPGFGAFLSTEKEIHWFVDTLVRTLRTGSQAASTLAYFKREVSATNVNTDFIIIARLNVWIETFEGKSEFAQARTLKEVVDAFDPTPF